MELKTLSFFCSHEYEKKKLLEEYYDYSGFKVAVFQCICRKCGKEKRIKYW